MGFDEEVDEVRSHKPLDLTLHVNEVSIGKGFLLQMIVSARLSKIATG